MDRLAREALSAVQLSKYAARDLWPCVTHLHELAVAAPERLEKASWEKASILLGAEQLVPPPLLPPIDAVLELASQTPSRPPPNDFVRGMR